MSENPLYMDNSPKKSEPIALWEDWGEIRGRGLRNREEKSLLHVAMVANFLDDNKPKIHLKREFAPF